MEEKATPKSGFRHWVFVALVIVLGAVLYLVLISPGF